MAEVRDDCRYTEKHEWAREEGGLLLVGISDFAQDSLGDIVYVDVQPVDTELDAQESFGAIESVKAAEDLYAPVQGVVAEINEDVAAAPEKINGNAYESWIVKFKNYDSAGLSNLMDAAAYKDYLASLS